MPAKEPRLMDASTRRDISTWFEEMLVEGN